MQRRPRTIASSLAVMLVATAVTACGGSDADPATTAVSQITAADLHARMASKDFVLVNVHTPWNGDIPETDLRIPFDEIEARVAELPSAKDTAIVLYCRSGHMSAQAARTLVSLGFTDVYDLTGGQQAWAAAGY